MKIEEKSNTCRVLFEQIIFVNNNRYNETCYVSFTNKYNQV